jgi:hypothetical protein
MSDNAVSAIENELLEASNQKPIKKNEDRQKYLTRVMLKIANLEDPEWEALSKGAQDWTNNNAQAHKRKGELEDFPDYEEVESTDEEQEEVVAKPVKEEVPVRKKEYAPRKVSACHMVKKIVVKNPTISISDLSEKLKGDGLKISDVTIATLRSDVRDTLRILNELELGTFAL